jgi:simple sugar transport system permease protein
VVNRTCDVPIEIINIVQAVIIMFVAADRFLIEWKRRKIVEMSQRAAALPQNMESR